MDELANLSPDKIEAMLDRLEAEKIRRLPELLDAIARGSVSPEAYFEAIKKIEWFAWIRDLDIQPMTKTDRTSIERSPSSKPTRSKLPPSAKIVSLSEARARRANTDLGEAYR